MLEPFIYPVSGVLKLWHILLHSVFGMNDSTAWLVSIFGLVLTVRLFLVPFFWMQAKSARISTAMRPEQLAIKEEFAARTDKESVAEQMRREKELKERYGHKVSAGCVPALIQLPVFLGLYQVLIRMARPSDESAVAADTRIGFLNAEEIRAFLRATVNDVPLPAYISMPEQTLARLGTTAGDVRDFILPYLAGAVVFTTVNMIISIIRNQQTMDWESGLARRMHRFIIVVSVLVPFLLIWLVFNGPLPVAIVLYWFANNLWTSRRPSSSTRSSTGRSSTIFFTNCTALVKRSPGRGAGGAAVEVGRAASQSTRRRAAVADPRDQPRTQGGENRAPRKTRRGEGAEEGPGEGTAEGTQRPAAGTHHGHAAGLEGQARRAEGRD